MAIIPLPGTVQQAAGGLSGLDVNHVVTLANAQAIKAAGYDFCIRYIPRTAQLIPGNLSNAEAFDILNAGLALMVVQHVALPGWMPTADLGTAYGGYAAEYCQQYVGLPAGVNVWLDLEEVAGNATADDVIAYCQAWYAEVKQAGYVPGIYVGWGVILTSQQLYQNLSFQHYWRAYNADVAPVTRGYQLLQHTEKTVAGLTIDPNTTQNDSLGGTALWLSL